LDQPCIRWDELEKESKAVRKTIEEMVAVESPTTDRKACNRMAGFLQHKIDKLGMRTKRISTPNFGDHVVADLTTSEANDLPGILLLGHYDTVWPIGEISQRPIRWEAGRLYGPGIYDMKSGIALAIHAVEYLQRNNLKPKLPITMLWNSDEELGSTDSRGLIETFAKRSKYVLVFEPGDLPNGAVNTFRKGVISFKIEITGKSAHAGGNHHEGLNAIGELARQVITLENMTDYQIGTTVNVGVIQGGIRSNVVAESATAEVDVRTSTADENDRLIKAIQDLAPTKKGFGLKISKLKYRPPLEKHDKVVDLYEKARQAANELNLALPERASGAASDGNLTAALGIATLCGIGAVGEGAHAIHENIAIDWLPKRLALIIRLLQALT
jgi:glutamate carboxypeptidase